MEDLSRKVAFIEARLTLLERKLANAPSLGALGNAIEGTPSDPIRLACNEPGLMIFRMYPVERDHLGNEFCWVGNDGPIQFVIPVRPVRQLNCRLHFKPHPKVGFSEASVIVNDAKQDTTIVPSRDDTIEVAFGVPATSAVIVNILLTGVSSVRPADLGENDDVRLLAARFFGAEIIYS